MANSSAALPAYLTEQLAHSTDDRRANVIVATVFCIVAAWLAVGLRFVARGISRAQYKWDDWMILLGLVYYIDERVERLVLRSVQLLGTVNMIDTCIGALRTSSYKLDLLTIHLAILFGMGRHQVFIIINPDQVVSYGKVCSTIHSLEGQLMTPS